MARVHERHDTFDSSFLCWLGTYLHRLPTCFSLPVLQPRYIYIARILAGYIWQCVPGHRVELIEKRQGKCWPTMKLRIFVRSKGHLCFGFWILDDGSVMTGLSSLLCDIFSEFLREWLDRVIECLGYVRIRKMNGLLIE